MTLRFIIWLAGCGLGLTFAAPAHAIGRAQHFVLVVWDGMRPDFVSPELTPTLHALRSQGVWFANHHSAYPTSTEVNGTVLATGVFPQRNGITANKEYRREIDPLTRFGTQSLSAVRRGDELSGGKYVALPTLAELVQSGGLTTAVAGAKPVALLHDRRARGSDTLGQVWFAEGCLPETNLAALTNRFGAFPREASPNLGRDEWATRCLTESFWDRIVPRYSVLWLSEPDFSQHQHGPGSPQALEAIRNCDQRLAIVLHELERRGVREQTDILVVSDHGFSTIGANADAAAALRVEGINARSTWDQPPVNGDVVVVGNGGSVLVYVVGHLPGVIQRVVTALQQQPFSGVVFTREGLPGTFPLSEAKIATATAPDVVVATRWIQKPTKNGHPVVEVFNDGYNEYDAGCGMHVTLSPLDLHNIAVACGPDFRRGVVDPLPSGNVDIVPTLAWLMGIAPPQPLDGRVLSEALAQGGPPLHGAELGRRDSRLDLNTGTWEQHLNFTELNGVRYLEEGNGGWTPSPVKAERTTAAKTGG